MLAIAYEQPVQAEFTLVSQNFYLNYSYFNSQDRIVCLVHETSHKLPSANAPRQSSG